MKSTSQLAAVFSLLMLLTASRPVSYGTADPATFLADIKTELTKEWPKNRSITLLFHGHSVPAGYFKTPVVNTLGAYPNQLLKHLKERYPTAVINVLVTAIGGEHSEQGAARFQTDVLPHKPDVLFIDYALNDRGIGVKKARQSWQTMIEQAQQAGIKVILLTPSPDLSVDMSKPDNELNQHANQIRQLADIYQTGLVDSYQAFDTKRQQGDTLSRYMAQGNHPNEAGHTLIVDELMKWF
ncbi:SGNH/GDSL hydrolase family protein [Spirosoma pollinicola]|uniref:Lipase n=1 Tax=Spirosoma pollinicola TaxID=2057025 RepID=A0A2K8YUW2_9BACT|nr:SGNH/GDSL hydrolase family protein [Spirosoma pollinicola]AUD01417.1 lipase [Spirosoma pollinicola]